MGKNIDHEEFLTRDDYEKVDKSITNKKLEEVNNHPLGDLYRKRVENNLKKKQKSTFIDDPLLDEDIVGEFNGKKLYKSDANDFYSPSYKEKIKKPESESELRRIQFEEMEKIKKEMKENNDHRHLFFISKGTFVSNNNGRFFRGNLTKDILALISKNDPSCFELKPFVADEKIVVSFHSKLTDQGGEREVPKDSRVKHKSVLCVDLEDVHNSMDLKMALLSKR